MKRILIPAVLVFVLIPVIAIAAEEKTLAAEQKPLAAEEVLKLKNYELNLQNMQLQIELLNREIQKFKNERDTYIEGLYKKYSVDQKWRIDLEKGVWFLPEIPQSQ